MFFPLKLLRKDDTIHGVVLIKRCEYFNSSRGHVLLWDGNTRGRGRTRIDFFFFFEIVTATIEH